MGEHTSQCDTLQGRLLTLKSWLQRQTGQSARLALALLENVQTAALGVAAALAEHNVHRQPEDVKHVQHCTILNECNGNAFHLGDCFAHDCVLLYHAIAHTDNVPKNAHIQPEAFPEDISRCGGLLPNHKCGRAYDHISRSRNISRAAVTTRWLCYRSARSFSVSSTSR